MEIEVAFGQVLRDFRKRAKVSQESLALECSLDRTFISLLERGLRQPTLKSLFRIATALKVSPASIVEQVDALLQSKAKR